VISSGKKSVRWIGGAKRGPQRGDTPALIALEFDPSTAGFGEVIGPEALFELLALELNQGKVGSEAGVAVKTLSGFFKCRFVAHFVGCSG